MPYLKPSDDDDDDDDGVVNKTKQVNKHSHNHTMKFYILQSAGGYNNNATWIKTEQNENERNIKKKLWSTRKFTFQNWEIYTCI